MNPAKHGSKIEMVSVKSLLIFLLIIFFKKANQNLVIIIENSELVLDYFFISLFI